MAKAAVTMCVLTRLQTFEHGTRPCEITYDCCSIVPRYERVDSRTWQIVRFGHSVAIFKGLAAVIGADLVR